MIKTAILGFGTVGSGVAEVLTMNAETIARTCGEEVSLKYIVDIRDFPDSPFADKIVKDFSAVEHDPEVGIVAETIGGVTVAYDFTKRALMAGKSVVTSNKELVAKHGRELLAIAKDKNVNYLFEASVGGGIPILRPLMLCLAGNRLEEVCGILNGTTNYILTQMIGCGVSFDDALASAQELGYAEANPAADIEGTDACRKICILADLCFGKEISPDLVTTEGITGITLQDMAIADEAGYKIKLLGRTLRVDGRVSAYVAPHLVPKDNLLAGVDGVMNAVAVKGNAIGEAMFYGPGAGKLPTASAVVGDIIDAAQNKDKRRDIGWEVGTEDDFFDPGELVSPWYVRAEGDGELKNAEVLEKGVCAGADGTLKYTAYKTDMCSRSALDRMCEGLSVKAVFRVLEF